jgi:hypothetical protein
LGWIYIKCVFGRWINQTNIDEEKMLIINILTLTLGYYVISCQKNIQNVSMFGFLILAIISSSYVDCVWHRLLFFESAMILIKFSTGILELITDVRLGGLTWKFCGLVEWIGLITILTLDIFETHTLSWQLVFCLMCIPFFLPTQNVISTPENRLFSATLCIPSIPTISEIILSISEPQIYSV